MAKEKDDIFNEDNLVENNWLKFNVFGDNIHGTLVAVREMKSNLPGKTNEIVKVYEIKADGGSFHDSENKKISEDATDIAPGEFWNVGGGLMIDNALRNVKLGTKIGIKYTDDKPNKQPGFNPLKIKKVFVRKDAKTGGPLMDEQWLKENTSSDMIPL